MAGYSNSGKQLFDDEEVGDEEFLNRPSNYMLNNSQKDTNNWFPQGNVNLDDKRQELLQKKRELEQRTVKSTERSLSYLRNSEEVGVATAEELGRQREQLERTEKRLDDINTTLRFSQRHIQGIKSVFGGLKNLISGKTAGNSPSSSKKPELSDSTSTNFIEVVDRNTTSKSTADSNPFHPGLKVRGFYDAEEDTTFQSEPQDVIDKNLDQMLNTITKLKGLSYNLGDEIESQNDLINKVIDKTEIADCSLRKQNRDMNKLLK